MKNNRKALQKNREKREKEINKHTKNLAKGIKKKGLSGSSYFKKTKS